MQTDPIGYADGMNWYNYVHGDPVNKSDPSGKACHDTGYTSNHDVYHNSTGYGPDGGEVQLAPVYDPSESQHNAIQSCDDSGNPFDQQGYGQSGNGGMANTGGSVIKIGDTHVVKSDKMCNEKEQGSIDVGETKRFFGGKFLKISGSSAGLFPIAQGFDLNVFNYETYNIDGGYQTIPNMDPRGYAGHYFSSAVTLYYHPQFLDQAIGRSPSGVYNWVVHRSSINGVLADNDAGDDVDVDLATSDCP